jgi:hypothetical protein
MNDTFSTSAHQYLSRFQAKEAFIARPAGRLLGIVAVIPCINEPDIAKPLGSLYSCIRPGCDVEVIVMVNAGQSARPEYIKQNLETAKQAAAWDSAHGKDWIKTYACTAHGLSDKHAGAGWARKLGMDEAVRRLLSAGRPEGIIAGIDADCTCSADYFTGLENAFGNKSLRGCSLYFTHKLDETEEFAGAHRHITEYELQLRYLVHALRWTGMPFGYHTVGSAMAVRAIDYCKVGGMNRRTAGEDFYFLSKLMLRPGFAQLSKPDVYPSARVSGRVPFGTGAAMSNAMSKESGQLLTYQFGAFSPLKQLKNIIEDIYNCSCIKHLIDNECHNSMANYIADEGFHNKLNGLRKNCSSAHIFKQRFYEIFTPFAAIKYLNYSHSGHFTKMSVTSQSSKLLAELNINCQGSLESLSLCFKQLDRKCYRA